MVIAGAGSRSRAPARAEVALVSDEGIRAAQGLLWSRYRIAAEPGALLARIEDEGHTNPPTLVRILQHGFRIIGGDNREVASLRVPERQLGGVGHRPGVEAGDLAVGLVGIGEE